MREHLQIQTSTNFQKHLSSYSPNHFFMRDLQPTIVSKTTFFWPFQRRFGPTSFFILSTLTKIITRSPESQTMAGHYQCDLILHSIIITLSLALGRSYFVIKYISLMENQYNMDIQQKHKPYFSHVPPLWSVPQISLIQ